MNSTKLLVRKILERATAWRSISDNQQLKDVNQ